MISVEMYTFEAEEIRDTNIHWGDILDLRGFSLKTIIVENDLNQTVSLECWGSRHEDFSKSFLIGTSWDVTATTYEPQTCTYYYPFMRIKATCSVAPTSGDLDVVFLKIGEA